MERANNALDQQLERNVDEMRDLAIAVAEKVVSVSLKSSSEVIGKMIHTAIDKRKRREWVRIYLAECDAKRLQPISPPLAAALASLSDQVRIVPVADDESGTCIIEMPDEIIDASASTQLSNIRSMARDYLLVGEELWQRFNMNDREKQAWYYTSMIDLLKDLNETPEYQEYVRLCGKVFGGIAGCCSLQKI